MYLLCILDFFLQLKIKLLKFAVVYKLKLKHLTSQGCWKLCIKYIVNEY